MGSHPRRSALLQDLGRVGERGSFRSAILLVERRDVGPDVA